MPPEVGAPPSHESDARTTKRIRARMRHVSRYARASGADLFGATGRRANHTFEAFQRFVELGRIGAAGLGHVRTTAARSAHDLGDGANELGRLEPGAESFGNGQDELNLGSGFRTNQHHAVAELVSELLCHLAQRADV